MVNRIPVSKIKPDYLKSNSTSHPWAFGAFAELIDNSFDAKAREVQIDLLDLNDRWCLSFQDDGSGMDKDQLFEMLSFGFSGRFLSTAIGKYGNGFKSSTMRLGKDAVVFTRTQSSAGIGFLSQSYNEGINTDSLQVPMLQYSYPDLARDDDVEVHKENLNAILDYTPFKNEDELLNYVRELPKTGTLIIVLNLEKNPSTGNYELDFDSDLEDIRCLEVDEENAQFRPGYRNSLKEYCSILYLHPRMKIKLRGTYVQTRLVKKSLCQTRVDSYTPTGQRSVPITFGFLPSSNHPQDYGMMLYTDNRLIQAYVQVSCQKQGDGVGAGVVGITQAKFLTPIQNKQDFFRDSKYIAAMTAYNNKLRSYWKSTQNEASTSRQSRSSPDTNWVMCDYKNCMKWRRLPLTIDIATLPAKWYCHLHPDNISCSTPADPDGEEEEIPCPRRSRTKRRSDVRESELINGKRGKRNRTTVSLDSSNVDVGSEQELTPSTSHLALSDSDQPSTSTDKRTSSKSIHFSNSQINKIAHEKSSRKLNPSRDVERSSKTGNIKHDRENQLKSSKLKATADGMSVVNGYVTADNTDTLVDREQHYDDEVDTSIEFIPETVNSRETSVQPRPETVDSEEISVQRRPESVDSEETSLQRRPESVDSEETSVQRRPESVELILIEKNKEIAKLTKELIELRKRLNDFLQNSTQLLAMLAPDIQIGQDVDIEIVIAKLVQEGLTE